MMESRGMHGEFKKFTHDVAATDPTTQIPGQYGIYDMACLFCRATDSDPHKMPKEHKPDCLWVKARRLLRYRELSPEERSVAEQMIADGQAICESNTLDNHKATRIRPDGGFYCDQHDENNY